MSPNPVVTYTSLADESDRRDDAEQATARSYPNKTSAAPTVMTREAYDEEQPLLGRRRDDDDDDDKCRRRLTPVAIAVLLAGEFLAHADTTLIFAAAPHIASELGSLSGASWLAVAYTLAVCAFQPLCGRLSDVFGRRAVLLAAYGAAAAGCALCGLGQTMALVVAGRAVGGVGGAGIMTMASIIITDSVARRDFASYRSYINLATTLGRGAGGPLGGLISDNLGWPWLFLLRIPFFAASALAAMAYLPESHQQHQQQQQQQKKKKQGSGAAPVTSDDDDNEDGEYEGGSSPREQAEAGRGRWSKLKEIDFKGAALLAKTIVSLVLLLDRAQHGFRGADNIGMLVLCGVSVAVFGQLFVLWELWGCRSSSRSGDGDDDDGAATPPPPPPPIFDLRILARPNAALSYLVDLAQVFAQVSMMFSVPMYFQVTGRASVASSGYHLVPAIAANTVGALGAGWAARRFASSPAWHRRIAVGCGVLGAAGCVLLLARWNASPPVGWAESLYVVPGGLATGMAQSVSFVTMASHLEQGSMAMATGWFFLCSSLGTASGVTVTNVLIQAFFGKNLRDTLPDGPQKAELIQRVTSDIESIDELTGATHQTVVAAFVGGLKATYFAGLVANILCSCFALGLRSD